MKKLLVFAMMVMALTCLLAVPAFSAPKLIVKDSGGTNSVFEVRDGGAPTPPATGYIVDVAAANVSKSLLHFSLNGTDDGGYITTVLPNNFFLSSGTAYDAAAGGWIAKSTQGIIAGSGGAGYRVLTANGCTIGTVCTPTTRLTLDYNGNLTITGSLSQGSSRDIKEDIENLSAGAAVDAFNKLTPVTYKYKNDAEHHVGFIAEDVPALVATQDRKHLSAMDIVAVLTKVVQEQNKTIAELSEKVNRLATQVAKIKSKDIYGSVDVRSTSGN